jgi:hypothetical protein
MQLELTVGRRCERRLLFYPQPVRVITVKSERISTEIALQVAEKWVQERSGVLACLLHFLLRGSYVTKQSRRRFFAASLCCRACNRFISTLVWLSFESLFLRGFLTWF